MFCMCVDKLTYGSQRTITGVHSLHPCESWDQAQLSGLAANTFTKTHLSGLNFVCLQLSFHTNTLCPLYLVAMLLGTYVFMSLSSLEHKSSAIRYMIPLVLLHTPHLSLCCVHCCLLSCLFLFLHLPGILAILTHRPVSWLTHFSFHADGRIFPHLWLNWSFFFFPMPLAL